METRNQPSIKPEARELKPASAKSEQDVYYGSDKLIGRYVKAVELLGVQDSVTVLPEKPEWADKKVRIQLDKKARKGFFKKVVELEDEEGL